MKTYRVSRLFRWRMTGAKLLVTMIGVFLYVYAVTHPTPLAFRLVLLMGMAVLGWRYYVRLPRTPLKIDVTEDGWIHFQSPKETTRVPASAIRSVGRSFGRRTIRVQHEKGKIDLPNRFREFFDFLVTLKTLNPAVDVKGY
ncbi:MAG: hypothetical protein NVSMB9_19810 [Isosphaeraceae bacterium]